MIKISVETSSDTFKVKGYITLKTLSFIVWSRISHNRSKVILDD